MNFLNNPDFLPIIIVVLSLLTIILFVLLIQINSKMKKFLINVDAHNISDSLAQVSSDLNNLQKFQKEIETYLAETEKRIKKGIRSVQTIRFNPFKGTGEGGNQSFATAFLNEDGDGVIISSLYSRERVSVFSKPIKGFSSEHELSGEEKEALEKAVSKLK